MTYSKSANLKSKSGSDAGKRGCGRQCDPYRYLDLHYTWRLKPDPIALCTLHQQLPLQKKVSADRNQCADTFTDFIGQLDIIISWVEELLSKSDRESD